MQFSYLNLRLPLEYACGGDFSANARNFTFNENNKSAPTRIILKDQSKMNIRSFLQFGSPATIWTHDNKKNKVPGLAAITQSMEKETLNSIFCRKCCCEKYQCEYSITERTHNIFNLL